jgi:GTP-dependent phosphoenolpyruvate carboxykinase
MREVFRAMTTNPNVLNWIEEMKALAKPNDEIWIDGSESQINELWQKAIDDEVITPLNSEKLPGCVLHKATVSDSARTEQRTFVCTADKQEAGPNNNWKSPEEAHEILHVQFDEVMKGKTMYIVPFMLGNKAAIEITDSIYVVINLLKLVKCGKEAVDFLNSLSEEDTGKYFKGIHSTGSNVPRSEDNRYICHFPQENSVWAINTGYGANAFLNKEAMALRLASCSAKSEGWLAEHMAVLEITTPNDDGTLKVTYIAVAFPSGCGKTSLAMLEVPQKYADKGYCVKLISDDVAWLKKGKDGRLWAINPETGIFGLAPGVNEKNTPNVLSTTQKDTIFANTAHRLNDNTVWWEGLDDNEIENMLDWKGNEFELEEILNKVIDDDEDDPLLEEDDIIGDFIEIDDYVEEEDEFDEFGERSGLQGEMSDDAQVDENGEPIENSKKRAKASSKPRPVLRRASHSNSRFTSSITNCPCLSPEHSNPDGVPISAIVFGGRRSKTIPLVYQAFDWEHGVFVGSGLGTEAANATGNSNTVRRDPMAMLPYCGYNTADYFRHWLKMGKKLGRNAPKIFNVNWFKNGENGTPMWPGFGENIRVLDWIVQRSTSKKFSIIETAVGYVPKIADIDFEGLDFTDEVMLKLFSVEKVFWKEDVNSMKQFYAKFGDKLPEELKEQLIDLEKRLMNS